MLYFEDLPIFYWPYMATDLNEPSFSAPHPSTTTTGLRQAMLTDFNVYQLLGIHKPPRDRMGPQPRLPEQARLRIRQHVPVHDQTTCSAFPASRRTDRFWGIHDRGYDNLGIDRSDLQPEDDYRYRFLLQHRQKLPDGFQLTVEGGEISDRNFLQEYFKREWDELKDETTDVEFEGNTDNTSWNVSPRPTDDFVTQTEWLPRADHSGWGNRSLATTLHLVRALRAGYGSTSPCHRRRAIRPTSLQPSALGAGKRQGDRLISRQELDLPFQVGPVKVVPYVLGELGHWGEDINGQPLDRAYGQVGVRPTLPMWTVDPTVESDLWNVHGMAHKVDFEMRVLRLRAPTSN